MKKTEEVLGYSNPTVVSPNSDGVIRSPIVKQADVFGANTITDSAMAEWVEAPTGCSLYGIDTATNVETNNLFPRKTTDKDTGTYAVRFAGQGTTKISAIQLPAAGLSESDDLYINYRAKTTGTGSLGLWIEYESGEDLYIWNWTGAAAGTFTLEGDWPTADQILTQSLTTAYATYTTTAAVVPAAVTGMNVVFLTADNNVYLDNVTQTLNEAAPSSISDFETWGLMAAPNKGNSNLLYAYELLEGGSSTFGSALREGTIKPTGATYSYKMIAGSSGLYAPFQAKTGLTPGATYEFGIEEFVPAANATATGGVLILNAPFATATQYFDVDTGTWVTDAPQNGLCEIVGAEDTWTEYTTYVTVPATGDVYIHAVFSNATEGDIIYAAKFAFAPVTVAESKTLFELTNTTDAANLESTDVVETVVTTGGTDFNHRTLNGVGAYTTDYTKFNFADKPVLVGNATAPGDALSAYNTVTLLATTAAINMKTTAATTLYTVPAGYTLYLDRLDFAPAIDTLTDGPIFQIGSNDPDYSNYNTWAEVITDDWATGDLVSLMAGGTAGTSYVVKKKYAAGDVIKLKVTTGAVATTYTAITRVFGYLVAN